MSTTNGAPRRRKQKIPEIIAVHPYAALFPMLDSNSLADLADDIARNGQRDPIVVTADGLLLEGRNRLAACKLANVEPVVEVHDGSDPAQFVISKNIHRRHLTLGQQAMIAAKVLVEDGRRVEGRWARGSVESAGIGNTEIGNTGASTFRNAMAKAGTVLDYAPEFADPVIAGKMRLDKAFNEAEARKPGRKPIRSKPPIKDPEPTGPPSVAVQVADIRMLLQKAKASQLAESVKKDLHVVRREITRILKDDLNGTETES